MNHDIYFAPHITVACVVQANNQFLLVEEMIDSHIKLNQPAGHVEENENIVLAAKRELWEETGLSYSPQALLKIYQWQADDNTPFIRFTFVIDLDEQPLITPHDKDIIGYRWLSAQEIIHSTQLRSPLVRESILCYQQQRYMSLDLLQQIESQ